MSDQDQTWLVESKRSLESLEQITRLAHRLTGAAGVMLSLFEHGTQHIVCAAGSDAAAYAGAQLGPGETLCSVVVTTGIPIVCGDTHADPELASHVAVTDLGTGAYVGFPLRGLDDTALGSLCVWESSPRRWSDELVDDLRDLAGGASTQLAFARLARERAESERELLAQRAFDAAVLDSLAEGVVACDEQGRLSLFNRALREIHGVHDDGEVDWASTYQLLSADGERLLEPDEVPLARAFAGFRVVDEPMTVGGGDSGLREFLATGTQLCDADGTRIGAVVAMRDVTAEGRRRRYDAAQLAAATRLAAGPIADGPIADGPIVDGAVADGPTTDAPITDGGVAVVLDVLRTALRTSDVTFTPSGPQDGPHLAVQQRIDERRAELIAPVQVAGRSAGQLRVVGEPSELLDQQASSLVTALAGMVSRQLELAHVRDLSDDLHRTQVELERVIGQIQDFVFSIEVLPDGRVVPLTSGSSVGVLGGELSPATEWRQFFDAHVAAEDRHELKAWRIDLQAGRPAQMTCRFAGIDGVTRWVWTRSKPRREAGRLFVDGISTDVTERQRLHLEREQLLRERARQVEQLEALDAAKSEFVATVAHEIRGPLGVVVTFADHAHEAMDEDGGPLAASMGSGMAAARRSAGLAARTAGHLQQVVENLFDLARYDAGVLSPQLDDVDLAALLSDVEQSATPAARAGELALRLDTEPAAIRVDATKLRQAIDNIMGNAVKFTPAGGAVHLSCAVRGETVEIRIADTGIGIPPDDLPHLFSRFYRASNARTTMTPGTGLGLALARSIVEAHGGRVTVEPNTPSGTVVTLCLPR